LNSTALQALLLLSVAQLVACEPSCENTCEKILACDEVDTPLIALQDCTDACLTQEQRYEDWNDGQKQEAMSDFKTCVADNECSDIAEAVCYDEEIYSW
jgi:hypothetical protein